MCVNCMLPFQKLRIAYPDSFTLSHPASVLIKELFAPLKHTRKMLDKN